MNKVQYSSEFAVEHCIVIGNLSDKRKEIALGVFTYDDYKHLCGYHGVNAAPQQLFEEFRKNKQ